MPDDVAPDGTADKQHSQGRGVGISCGHVVGDHVHIRTEDASGLGGEPRHQAVAPVRACTTIVPSALRRGSTKFNFRSGNDTQRCGSRPRRSCRRDDVRPLSDVTSTR